MAETPEDIRLLQQQSAECEAQSPVKTDVDPSGTPEPCGDSQLPEYEFVDPPPPVAPDIVAPKLPAALRLAGSPLPPVCQGGKTRYDTTPDAADPEILPPTLGVLLDMITPAISEEELDRLAYRISDLQAALDQTSAGKRRIDALARRADADVARSELAGQIVAITHTSVSIASAIADELLQSQRTLNQLADSAYLAMLRCVYWNPHIMLVCSPTHPDGYDTYVAPAAMPDVSGMPANSWVDIPALTVWSDYSTADAISRAVLSGKSGLECLYGNVEQHADCRDAGMSAGLFGSVIEGPDGNDTTLTDLNGSTFVDMFASLEAGVEVSRTLSTVVTVPANTVFARTVAEANLLAKTSAIEQLNCFFPSRAVDVKCTDWTANAVPAISYAADAISYIGSLLTFAVEPGTVVARTPSYSASAVGRLTALEASGKDAEYVLSEMVTGESGKSRTGLVYPRSHNYGVVDGTVDQTKGVSASLGYGAFFSDVGQSAATDMARSYAASTLECVWRSPAFTCRCVCDCGTADCNYDHARYGKAGNSYRNLRPGSNDVSSLVEYVMRSSTGAPDRASYAYSELVTAALPADTESGPLWPELPAMCRSALNCLFTSTQAGVCQPKPDRRKLKLDNEPNVINWGDVEGAPAWLLYRMQAAYEIDHYFVQPAIASGAKAAWTQDGVAQLFGTDDAEAIKGFCYPLDATDAKLSDAMTAYWYSVNQSPGTPAKFVFGRCLGLPPLSPEELAPAYVSGRYDVGCSAVDEPCCDGSASSTLPDPSSETTTIPSDLDTLLWEGYVSGAVGRASQVNPEKFLTLVRGAVSDAFGRMVCDHTNWDRRIRKCPVPSHRPGNIPQQVLDPRKRPKGPTTELSNMTVEATMLADMNCQESATASIVFAQQRIRLGPMTMINIDESPCAPYGKCQPVIYNASYLEAITENSPELAATYHHGDTLAYSWFLRATCVYDEAEAMYKLKFALSKRLHPAAEAHILWAWHEGAANAGQAAAIETLPACIQDVIGTNAKNWYIGSVVIISELSGVTLSEPLKKVIQYHSGPFILQKTCCDSSSSSSSGSDSSGSSMGDSSSGSSGSSAPSSDSVPSDSAPSGDSTPSGSVPDGSTSGSDKSTAIVPAPWLGDDQFAALYCLEAPDIRFDDIMTVRVKSGKTTAEIDPRFVAVCEEGSILAVGLTTDLPANVGCSVAEGRLLVIYSDVDVFAVVRLSGIRKGHGGKRFAKRSRKQFDQNERFLNSAYDPE